MYSIPCKWSMNEMCLVYKGMLDSIVKRWKNATPKHCFTPNAGLTPSEIWLKKVFNLLHELSKNLQNKCKKRKTILWPMNVVHSTQYPGRNIQVRDGGERKETERKRWKKVQISKNPHKHLFSIFYRRRLKLRLE